MSLTKEMLQEVVKKCGDDGHTIYKAEAFDFLPEDFVKTYIHEYESDGSGKGDIFGNDGEIIPKVKGIYGLTLLRGVAEAIKADTAPSERYYGRGKIASALTDAINEVIGKM